MPPRRQAKRRTCLCPSGFRPPPRMRHNANTSPLPISRRAKAPALPQITAQANKCTRRENGLTAAAKQSLALCSPTVPLLSRRTVARSIKQAQNASRAGGDTSEPCTASHTAVRSEAPASAGKQARESSRAAAKNGTQTKRCAGQRGFRRQGAAIQTRRHSADAGRADKRPDGKRAALRASPI